MWKKFTLSIVVFIFFIIAFVVFSENKGDNSNKISDENSSNETKKIEEISETLVDDDCIKEWEDYKEYVKELEQTSTLYENEKTHYVIKSENNSIVVYYVDEEENLVLYKETEISTNYLGEEDLKELKKGIDVYGGENLNKLLEDFE